MEREKLKRQKKEIQKDRRQKDRGRKAEDRNIEDGNIGQDSPSSTFTVFSTSRVFPWKIASQRLRQECFKVG